MVSTLAQQVEHDFEPELVESEVPPVLVEISEKDRVFYNSKFSNDRRIRQAIYDKILVAKSYLPDGLTFMIYEAYRPRARQLELWETMWSKLKTENPTLSDQDLTDLCYNFVSNPHGVGSGHQFGCAIDITICDKGGTNEFDMGTDMQEFCALTHTAAEGITQEQRNNRMLLKSCLEKTGLINYPPEWWHYSYGDRLWARLLNKPKTVYSVLPF